MKVLNHYFDVSYVLFHSSERILGDDSFIVRFAVAMKSPFTRISANAVAYYLNTLSINYSIYFIIINMRHQVYLGGGRNHNQICR